MKLRFWCFLLDLAANLNAPEWLFIAIERRWWVALFTEKLERIDTADIRKAVEVAKLLNELAGDRAREVPPYDPEPDGEVE